MEIYSFGEKEENGVTTQWYANKEGNRTPCHEGKISFLWQLWVTMKGVSKTCSDDGFLVYSAPTPILKTP